MVCQNEEIQQLAKLKRKKVKAFKEQVRKVLKDAVLCAEIRFIEHDNDFYGFKNGRYFGVLSIEFAENNEQFCYNFDVCIDALGREQYVFEIRGFDKEWQQFIYHSSLHSDDIQDFADKMCQLLKEEINFSE